MLAALTDNLLDGAIRLTDAQLGVCRTALLDGGVVVRQLHATGGLADACATVAGYGPSQFAKACAYGAEIGSIASAVHGKLAIIVEHGVLQSHLRLSSIFSPNRDF
ncbi:MAG TPA: hypothetical protein VIT92_11975, partial [Burkholderiaceae bacterium]